jgi:protocatechuate 3,4-dioxygenase beta subunit
MKHAHDKHDDFGGLHRDLRATGAAIDRRQWLRVATAAGVGLGVLPFAACDNTMTAPSSATSSAGSSSSGSGSTAAVCQTRMPEETAGPYPGDSSNGPDVLNLSGVVRSDIRSSFAGLSGAADGVSLTIVLTLVSASSCAVLAGRAIYLWHCDRLGRYSLYSAGVTTQNYLRGVQEADASGRVTFTSIYPGCYAGRWPHIHFEVYPSLSAATSVANKIATSQIALPKDASDLIYAGNGYDGSATNLSRITLATDNVFSDGASLELATVTGSVASGLTAMLTIAV